MRSFHFRHWFSASLAVLLMCAQSRAGDRIWTNGSGNATWSNNVSGNWGPLSHIPWYNTDIEGAVFTTSGATSISLGTAIVARSLDFQSGSYTINGSGSNTLTLSSGGSSSLSAGEIRVASGLTPTITAQILGTIGLTKSGTGRLTLTGANSYSGGTNVNAGELFIGNGGSTGALGSGTVTIGSTASLSFHRNNAMNISTAFAGAGTVRFLGTGVSGQADYSLFTASPSFTGSFQVGAAGGGIGARVNSSTANVFGSAAVTIHNGSSVFATNNLSNSFNISGNGWTEAGGNLGALRLGSNAVVSGNLFMQSNSRVTVASGTFGTISGVIIGPFALEKTGAGNLTLSGQSTYTGTTTLSEGTTTIGSNYALPTNTVLTVASGATLALTDRLLSVRGLNGSGNITSSTGFLTVGSQDSTYSGVFSGNGSLVKSSDGTLTLTGANSHTGGTYVTGGSIYFNNFAALGSGSMYLQGSQIGSSPVANGNFQYTGSSTTTSKNIILSQFGGGIYAHNSGGTLTLTGTISETGGTGRSLWVGGDNSLFGGFGMKTVLTGTNTFTGPLVVEYDGNVSVASVANAGVASPIGAGSTIYLGNAGAYGGRGRFEYTGTTTGITNRSIVLGSGTFGEIALPNGNLQLNGVISGPGQLRKTGTGTLILNANNTHTGGTYLDAYDLASPSVIQVGTGTASVINGLGNGTVTLNGSNYSGYGKNTAQLSFYGSDTTWAGNILLEGDGGVITNTNSNTTVTLSGVISSSSSSSSLRINSGFNSASIQLRSSNKTSLDVRFDFGDDLRSSMEGRRCRIWFQTNYRS
jgi:fibronectin-binding autotransporter adhesin